MNSAEQNIKAATQQLRRSERGRGALRHVLDLLEGDGLGLDGENQRAVLTLIVGAWQGHPETVRDMAREALGK
ncbi:MAG: hypothetical protein HYV75_08615 [Opitutae bacterium]|nr:hypothetical protein [Opitutae bacterium]